MLKQLCSKSILQVDFWLPASPSQMRLRILRQRKFALWRTSLARPSAAQPSFLLAVTKSLCILTQKTGMLDRSKCDPGSHSNEPPKKSSAVAICEAMADRSLKVFQVTHRDNGRVWYMSELDIHAANGEWIKGAQLRETNGELLFTSNGIRANELKISESPVSDFEELKSRIGVPPGMKLVPIEKTWVDRLVFSLNHPAMVMLMIVLGVALIYVELHFMTGILGILSVLCFALFFWSSFMGGTAGWLEVVLFVLGIGCLGLEIFVIPGFGVFGVSGILLVLASLVMAG